MRIMAFKGFDNVEVFTVSQGGEDFDLSAAGFTSAEIIACDTSVEASIAGPEVSAVLGDLDLMAGEYEAKLVVYSTVYPDGLVIAGPGLPYSLRVVMKE